MANRRRRNGRVNKLHLPGDKKVRRALARWRKRGGENIVDPAKMCYGVRNTRNIPPNQLRKKFLTDLERRQIEWRVERGVE